MISTSEIETMGERRLGPGREPLVISPFAQFTTSGAEGGVCCRFTPVVLLPWAGGGTRSSVGAIWKPKELTSQRGSENLVRLETLKLRPWGGNESI